MKSEQYIISELITYFEGLFKSYPELKLTASANLNFTFISNSPQDYRKFEFDILIHKNGHPYIIVEHKTEKFLANKNESKLISLAVEALNVTKADYYIFTDGSRFKLINGRKFNEYSEIQKNRIKNLFEDKSTIDDINTNIDVLIRLLKEGFKKIGISEKLLDFNLENAFFYDMDNSRYYFRGDPNDLNGIENQFFRKLLPDFNDNIVFRYTTLSTLEGSLKNNTFRMNGIVGMNDPTEVDYVDARVFGHRKPIDEWNPDEIKTINNVFITSCTTRENEDNLTMWRLYGDDSKGVSFKIEVKDDCFNNNMILARVSYGEKGVHKQLDLIKSLIYEFYDETSAKFEYKTYETWKHFFKPFEYEIEKEVRLLYIKNDTIKPLKNDWIVTNNDKIFNPVVDFKLNAEDFPLTITEIILGPNTPEKNVNVAQLKEYIRHLSDRKKKDKKGNDTKVYEYLISRLDVKLSEINNYRKS